MSRRLTRSSFTSVTPEGTTGSETISTGTRRNPQTSSFSVEMPSFNQLSKREPEKRKRSSRPERSNDQGYDDEGNDDSSEVEIPLKTARTNTGKKATVTSKKMAESKPEKPKRSSPRKGSTNCNDDEDESSDSEDDDEEDSAYEVEKAPAKKSGRQNTRKKAPVDTTNWKKEATQLKKEKAELKKQANSFKRKIKDLNEELNSITLESFMNARKGIKEVWDTTKITTEFKRLGAGIKKWAKHYAIIKTISSLTDDKKENILSDESLFSYVDILPGNDLSAIEELPTGAKLLLEGFLYAFACKYLISRPFIFIDGALKDHGSRPRYDLLDKGKHEKLFQKFASQLEIVDEYQAQKWRASMLQSLKQVFIPDFLDDVSKTQQADQKRSNGFLKKYETEISTLVDKFLNSPAKSLFQTLSEQKGKQQREDLKKIFRRFRELAYHMYCQPSTVICQYENQDKGESSSAVLMFNSKTMELDPTATSHGDRQDTEPKRLAGDNVLISISPAIFGFTIDAHNGKRSIVTYFEQTVWTSGCQTYGQWRDSLKEQASNAVTTPIAPEKAIEATADNRQNGSFTVGEEKNHDAALPDEMECSPEDESDKKALPKSASECSPEGELDKKALPKSESECRLDDKQNDHLAAATNAMDCSPDDENKKAIPSRELECHPNDDNLVTDNESMCSDAIHLLQTSAQNYDQATGTGMKEEEGESASKGGFPWSVSEEEWNGFGDDVLR